MRATPHFVISYARARMVVGESHIKLSGVLFKLHGWYHLRWLTTVFRRERFTFLELKFKANWSFSFESFVAITVKRNDINHHYPEKEI